MKPRKPTEVQAWILDHMRTLGWRIRWRQKVGEYALFDSLDNLRRPIPQRTVDQMLVSGWIEPYGESDEWMAVVQIGEKAGL